MGRTSTVAMVIALLGAGGVCAQGPCPPIRDFLDPEGVEKKTSPCIPDKAQIGFLIALVPDPVNTRLALIFDRTVESLQAAIQDSGYSYASQYLPWRPAAGRGDSESGQSDAERASRVDRELQPGVLLFREADPAVPHEGGDCPALYEKRLGVLLVAETPTGGVNRKQFANAMSLVKQSREGRPGANTCPVPVVGPNFSGAMASLYEALQTHQKTHKFRIVTGTATSQSKWRWIRAKGVDFRSVIHNDSVAARMVVFHLRNEWRKTGPIAVISEDETSYGADLSNLDISGTSDPVLNIRFPREVSRLRNAYSDNPALVAESKTKQALPQQNLRLDLRASSIDQDSVTTFSKGQTPLSQDAVLTAIATALRRERIRFAIVGATDPLDAIFIVRALRTLCPDVRLVLLSADLLFLTAATETSLDGILTVTTYPLFLRNQHWTHYQLDGGQPRRLQFSSSLSQGTYNAARALLLRALGRVGYRREDELLEYFAPSVNPDELEASDRPPLWITALSRSGFWPVSLSSRPNDEFSDRIMQEWEHNSSHRNAGADAGLFRPDRLPRIYLLTFLIFSMLSVAVATVVIGSTFVDKWKTSFDTALFSVQFDEREPVGRAVYLLISLLALLAGYLLFVAPLWRLQNQPPPGRLFAIYLYASLVPVVLLAISVVSILAAVFPLRTPERLRTRLSSSRHSLHSVLFLIAGVLFIAACWAGGVVIWGKDEYQRGFFFAYRSLDLSNGVSPILPLLILGCAICVWGWTHNRRLLVDYERRTNLPDIGDPILIDLARDVNNSIRQPFLNVLRRVILAGSIILGTFLFLSGYVQSFETPLYDHCYLALLGGVVFLTFLTLFRFERSWSTMRVFLEQLERHPLRQAFTAMATEPAWSPMLQRGMLKRTYSLETCSRDTLMKIGGLRPKFFSSTDVADLNNRVNSLCGEIGKNRRLLSARRRNVGELLKELQAQTIAYLQAATWNEGYSESLALAVKAESGPDGQIAILAHEFVALPFLMYIRYVLLQLRNLLTFVLTGFVLALLSIDSYPFQSHHIMGWVMTAVFVLIFLIIGRVFVQMDRDAVFSRLSNTKAGKVDKTGLVLRLATVGLLPALTVLSTQFPAVGRFLFSWLQPTLEALR